MVSAPTTLHIKLLSDTTFGRGEGTAGVVDAEVEHDDDGLPFIGGKTIRGLLRDSWLSMCDSFSELEAAAARVLGRTRSLDEACKLRVGDAHVPANIREVVRGAVARNEKPLSPQTVLTAFTDIRYQTAEDRTTGAPATTTLRSSRVVVRGFSFEAPLTWLDGYQPKDDDLRLLALCVLTTRHGGLLRNRGRGHLQWSLDGDISHTKQLAGLNNGEAAA